jgi:Zn-dependent protease/CBS domain-containing protein
MRVNVGEPADRTAPRHGSALGYVGAVAHRTGLGAPAEHRDPGTLRIGSIGGVDVLVRTSWLLVAVLISYVVAPRIEMEAPGLGALTYVAGLAFAVLLTLSLLLHEVSHALVAKHYGIPVRSITLHFIGGVTAVEGEPATPRQEFMISVVGPVTSLAIGGAVLALYPITPEGLLKFVVVGLAGANLVVGALNLIPGLPLDGGRVLRSAVWKLTGKPHLATVASGWAGRVVAVLALLTPVLLLELDREVTVLDYALALVFGWFLWSAATAAIQSGRLRARLPALRARELARRVVRSTPDEPLSEAYRRAEEAQAGSIMTVDSSGRPAGLVNEAALAATPEERRPWVPVSAVTRTLEAGLTLPADAAGEALLRAMQRTPASEYLLVEADGSVYGVLSTRDVDKAFAAADD